MSKVAISAISVLLLYTLWVRGGSPNGYQPPIFYLGLVCLLVPLISRLCNGLFASKDEEPGVKPRRILLDPLFWATSGLLIFLSLQWHNSDRYFFWDQLKLKWAYAQPLMQGFPSSIKKSEAWEMLVWFLPVAGLIFSVRYCLATKRAIRLVLNIMIINSFLAGIFGIVQYVLKAKAIYWIQPMSTHFFSVFAYQNHAGEFFFLMLCLSVGMLFRQLFLVQKRQRSRSWMIIYLITAMVCLMSVHLALVAASVLLSWAVVVIAVWYAVFYGSRNLHPALRVNIIAGIVIFTMAGYYLVAGMAVDKLKVELKVLVDGEEFIKDVDTRWWQVVSAVKIWEDAPWYGTGGWGYRHLVGAYMPQAAWPLVKQTGRANVHNDTIQFLTEFGVVGLSLISIIVICLLWPCFTFPVWKHGMLLFMALGIGFLYVHSMIDLPFRSPAILQSTFLLLACLGRYVEIEKVKL